jgi:O-antigen/teichoic acid export membrane protein
LTVGAAESAEPDALDAGRPLAGSFATTAVIQVIQAVTAVLLARVLGPEGRGELAAALLWPTLIMTLGNFGIAPSATYHAARTSNLGLVVGSLLAIVVADSLLLIAIGAVVVPVALSGHESGVVETGLLYLLTFVPLSLLALAMMSILNGLHRFRWFQGLRLLMIATILAGVLLLETTAGLTIENAALAYAGAYLVAAAVAAAVVLRGTREPLRANRETVSKLLSFGLKSQLSTTMWALNERADQLVISIFLAATSLGLYVVAVTLTSLTTLVGFSFALVALPLLAKMGAAEERRATARAIVGATIVIGVLVTLPILAAEPLIVGLLFGEDFDGSIGVGRVLLVAAVVFGLNRVLEAILQAEGRPLDSSIGEGIGLAVTAGGLAALLPLLGIMGAGVTSLLAYLTSAAFLSRRAARALGVSVPYLLVPDRATLRRAGSLLPRGRR